MKKDHFSVLLVFALVLFFQRQPQLKPIQLFGDDHSKYIDEPIFKKMYDRYYGKWYKTITFTQTTENYRHDSLIRSSTWREAGNFPYLFRIDFGESKNGNGVIFTEDSTYNFQQGVLKNAKSGTNPFTFLLGGMYFVSYEAALARFKSQGYDLAKSYQTTWQGKKTYVVGAEKNDSVSNQFWVDAENLYVVRTIESEDGRRVDAQMNDHVKLNGGWSETKVMIYVDGIMVQVEKYKDLKADVILDKNLFTPSFYSQTKID